MMFLTSCRKENTVWKGKYFPVLAEEGSLAGFPFEGYFIDAGTPSSWHDGVLRCIEEKRFNVGSISQGSWHEGKANNCP